MCFLAVQAAVIVGVERHLPSAERHVLFIHAYHCNRVDGISWTKKETVMRETGLSAATVTRALHALVAAGLLVVHAYPKGGRGRSTEYRVLPSEWEADQEPTPREEHPSKVSALERTTHSIEAADGGETVSPGGGFSRSTGNRPRNNGRDYPGKSQKGITEGSKTPSAVFRSELPEAPAPVPGTIAKSLAAPSHQPETEPVQPTFARAREGHVESPSGDGPATPAASDATPWWERPGIEPRLRDSLRQVHARIADGPPPREAEAR